MPVIKILVLKNDPTFYLIGSVIELDEEPSLLVENCYQIVECAEYGDDPENLEKRAYSLEGNHVKLSARKLDEGAVDKDWYVYEYAILQKYPKYSSQPDLFLTSTDILTILDPAPDVLAQYTLKLSVNE